MKFKTQLKTLSLKILLALGNRYIEQNHFGKAQTVFEYINEIDPFQAEAFNSLGHVYFCLGDLPKALDTFQRAVTLDPTLALAHQNLGYIYSDLECYDKAISAFKNAIQLEPDNARPHYGLGLVYLLIGEEARATNILKLAISLDTLYVGPRISLAAIYQRQGKIAESLEQVRFVKPLIAGQKDYTRSQFAALYGNIEETLDWLEKVVVQAPGYRWTIRHAIDFTVIRNHPRFLGLLGGIDFSQPL